MQMTMATMLKTLLLSWPPQTPEDISHLVYDGLTTTMQLMRLTIVVVLKAFLIAHAFSCNMLLNVPLILEWQTFTHKWESLVNEAQVNSNQQWIFYDYFIGWILMKYDNTTKGKLAIKTSGHFDIVHIPVVGTVTIQLRAGMTQQIIPYEDPLV